MLQKGLYHSQSFMCELMLHKLNSNLITNRAINWNLSPTSYNIAYLQIVKHQ